MIIKSEYIIKKNKEYGGTLLSRSSLDYATEKANNEKNIYKSNAYLIRSIIVDHSFFDGNKRTATDITLERFKKHDIKCDKEKFSNGLLRIAKNEIRDIDKIEKGLRKWCKLK